MSLLSGIFSGVAGALGYPPLDPSHHPFKRSTKRPGGPRGKSDKLVEKWDCNWVAPYKQKCKKLGPVKPGTKRTKIVKVNRAWKKKYNKRYAKFVKRQKGGERFPKNKLRPNYAFKKPTAPKSRRGKKK